MPSADRLAELVAIVDHGSISAAARELDLPRATLSRRLAALEDELGVRLMHRETRRLVLTAAGEALLPQARCIVEDTQAAWRSVARLDDRPRGRLRVSVPPTSLFHELLLGFAASYPEVDLELAVSIRHADLVAERIDVALRFGPQPDGDHITRRLRSDEAGAVASPDYLAKHGRPMHPDDLRQHQCLLTFSQDWRRHDHWPLLAGGTTRVSGRLVCDEAPLRLHAALLGMGIAFLPMPIARPYIDNGQLERVLPATIGAAAFASLVYPERAFVPAQVRAFIDHTVSYFSEHLPAAPALPAFALPRPETSA